MKKQKMNYNNFTFKNDTNTFRYILNPGETVCIESLKQFLEDDKICEAIIIGPDTIINFPVSNWVDLLKSLIKKNGIHIKDLVCENLEISDYIIHTIYIHLTNLRKFVYLREDFCGYPWTIQTLYKFANKNKTTLTTLEVRYVYDLTNDATKLFCTFPKLERFVLNGDENRDCIQIINDKWKQIRCNVISFLCLKNRITYIPKDVWIYIAKILYNELIKENFYLS